MLIYVASYPRSGNSLIQRLIRLNFGYLPSQIKKSFLTPEVGWGFMSRAKIPGLQFPDEPPDSFCCPVTFESGDVRDMVLPLDKSILTPEFRQQLARDEKTYFLKTHEMPFDSFFEGEKVIYPVRHPGAVIWSYFRLLNDKTLPISTCKAFAEPPFTVENVIAGRVQFGNWTEYSTRWEQVETALGDNFLKIRFEEFTKDQEGLVDVFADFFQLSRLPLEVIPFDQFQSNFPTFGLRGSSEGFEEFFSKDQLKLLWDTHGEMATRLGYSAPNFDLGFNGEQIKRLNAIIDFGWDRFVESFIRREAKKSEELKESSS